MSIEPSLHFVNVDQDGQFFTDLSQIYNCLTIADSRDELVNKTQEDYRKLAIKALKNSITKGYVMRSKDECDILLPGYKIVKETRVVPYQLCPKCFGSGNIYTPICSGATTCDVCNGTKIVPQAII